MTNPVVWKHVASDGRARAGVLETPHGAVETPAFMPVGTRGAVRLLDSRDLREAGAQLLLANTYHLMLRPGAAVVRALGGIQRVMGWEGPVLTDSGGFQVWSLSPRVDEDGVSFRSTYDGSEVRLTPEAAVEAQETLGSDIAMVLDVLVGLPSPREVVSAAMEQTLRWSARAVAAKRRDDRALFGIVQGGVDEELRRRSSEETAALDVAGFGIGGLSVGESAADRSATIDVVTEALPDDKPRYVMGLGDTDGLIDAIGRGVDMFDCVIPTRLARHGKALTSRGDLSMKRADRIRETAPIDEDCSCLACVTYSRGVIRHLLNTGEALGMRLLSIHNVHYTLALIRDLRSAIVAGRFEEAAAAKRTAREFSQTDDRN